MKSKNEAPSLEPKLFRLIDANLNRLKEGIRVVEDIFRYIYDNKDISKKLKELRHLAKIEDYEIFLKYRDIVNDVLKESIKSEKNRGNLKDIILANLKRAQESARVLEESFKLIDTKKSEIFKKIRYELYNIEKEIILLLSSN